MAFDFTGKKILVTGAGRGIGRALAKALVQAGAEVYALSRTQSSLDSLVAECPGVHPIQVDLTDWEVARTLVDEIEPLDGLVNNAGVFTVGEALDISKEALDQTIAINLMAAINVSQSVGKKMVAAGKGGSIVNNSSILAVNPWPNSLAVAVSKAGLDMVTKQFALELGPHRIRVNSINPTVIPTELTEGLRSDPVASARVTSRTPLGRFGQVRECVDLIMFLLSDRSTMTTGTINPLDGGILANILF